MRLEAWRPQIERFQTTHRVVVLDMPGHGESDPAPTDAKLDDFADRAVRLLDALEIDAANVVGHSMGALVTLALATRCLDRCLRIACLNAVYQRDEESRRAVRARAEAIRSGSGMSDIAGPLRRWFGDTPSAEYAALIRDVGSWLKYVSPAGYATAYKLFAEGDTAFIGKLTNVSMPSLFLTGELDPNSTPAMSEAMASAAPNGQCRIIKGARHMMNLTHVDQTNEAIESLLREPTCAVGSSTVLQS
jgi:pimeloyl-ACP methyl ester carboxylesterase